MSQPLMALSVVLATVACALLNGLRLAEAEDPSGRERAIDACARRPPRACQWAACPSSSNRAAPVVAQGKTDKDGGLALGPASLAPGTYRQALGKVSMPGFGKGYSDAEIAAVVNVVTGRFGTSASALTLEEVAKRRQEN